MSERIPRLSRIKMERFGRFSNESIGPLGEGLTVLSGKNEAGKSTTTSFISQLLYGWNRKGSSGGHYGMDGPRKGSLFFSSEDGEWELSRTEGNSQRPLSVVSHSGAMWDDAYSELTSGVDKDTFASIFAFDSDQLRGIAGGKDDVTSKLITAESATPVSPVDARSAIQAEMQGFTSAAAAATNSIPLIGKRILELKGLIAELKAQERGRIEERLEMQVLEEEVLALRERIARGETVSAELAARITELESLRDRYREARGERDDAAEALESRLALKSQVERDAPAVLCADEVAALAAGLPAARTLIEDTESERANVAALAAEVGKMTCLGCAVDASVKAGISERRDALLRLEGDVANRRRALDAATAEESGARARVEQVIDIPVPNGPPRANGALIAAMGAALVAILGLVLSQQIVAVIGLIGVLGALAVVVVKSSGIRTPRTAPATGAQHEVLAAELRGAVGRRAEAETALALSEGALGELRAEVRSYLDGRGLGDSGDDPDIALSLVTGEERVLARKQDLQDARTRLDVREQRLGDWLATARNALAGLEPLSEDATTSEAAVAVTRAAARCRAALEAEQAAAARDQEVAAARERYDRAQRQMATVVERITSLADISPESIDVPSLEGLLASMRVELGEHRESLETLERERDEKSARSNEIRGELGAVERDRRLQEAEADLAQQEVLRAGYIARYAELLLAKKILEESIARWEAVKQPEIYRQASRLFQKMTYGRWIEVRAGEKSGEFTVVDSDHSVKKPSELSTGTVQQLYLSLRMALLDVNPEVGRSLPVVMDDPLVHFDPERRAEAVRAITEFSARRQVIFFTCDPETSGLFAEYLPDHTRIAL